jgi:plastocyanin
MAFGEPPTVAPGATITVVNKDTVEHSVTSKTDGKFSKDRPNRARTRSTASTTRT